MGSAASFLYPNAPVVFREICGRAEGGAGSERERDRERERAPQKTKISRATLGAMGRKCACIHPSSPI
jgi:hypothetical protein